MLLSAELGKISPDMKGGAAQELKFLVRKFLAQRGGRFIEPDCNQLAARPQTQNRNGGSQRTGPNQPHHQSYTERQDGHPIEVAVNRSAAGTLFSLSRSFPLQKPFACNHPAHQSANHCVEREQHLVSQENNRQEHGKIAGVEIRDRFLCDRQSLLNNGLHQAEYELEPHRDKEYEDGGESPANGTPGGNQP